MKLRYRIDLPLSLLLAISFLTLSCSSTKFKIPENYVDEPPILPAKMYSSSITYNKAIHELDPGFRENASDAIIEKSTISLAHLLYVRKSVSDNWEMSTFPIPIKATYLFGKNDFENHNRIGYNKFYHLLNFGLTTIGYSARDSWTIGAEAIYKNVYVLNGLFKSEFATGLNYQTASDGDRYELHIPINSSVHYKANAATSPYVMLGASYSYSSDESMAPYFIEEEHRIGEGVGVGVKYSFSQWLKLNVNYSQLWEQYEDYYMSKYQNRKGPNYFWNANLSFFW